MDQVEAGNIEVLPEIDQNEIERTCERRNDLARIPCPELHERTETCRRELFLRIALLVRADVDADHFSIAGARGLCQENRGVAVGRAELDDGACAHGAERS